MAVAEWPFQKVVCAIDGSAESLEAAYQGCRLASGCPVTLVHVIDTFSADYDKAEYVSWVHSAREEATEMLSWTQQQLTEIGITSSITITVEEGDIPNALKYITCLAAHTVLLTIGSGEEKLESFDSAPPAGVKLVNDIVETVPCSVLVGRAPPDHDRFPSSITVGVDGSELSMHAHKVAATIAEHHGGDLRSITVLDGKGVDLRTLQEKGISTEVIERESPAVALSEAANKNGIIIVGSRGLHGLRALGSVSARVVSHSPVTVIVVRDF